MNSQFPKQPLGDSNGFLALLMMFVGIGVYCDSRFPQSPPDQLDQLTMKLVRVDQRVMGQTIAPADLALQIDLPSGWQYLDTQGDLRLGWTFLHGRTGALVRFYVPSQATASDPSDTPQAADLPTADLPTAGSKPPPQLAEGDSASLESSGQPVAAMATSYRHFSVAWERIVRAHSLTSLDFTSHQRFEGRFTIHETSWQVTVIALEASAADLREGPVAELLNEVSAIE